LGFNDLNSIGSIASIIGLLISLVGAAITLLTFRKVTALKREFVFNARAKVYLEELVEKHRWLKEKLDASTSLYGNDRKSVCDTFKSMQGMMEMIVNMAPQDNKSLLHDAKTILKLIEKHQEKGKLLSDDDYWRGLHSLSNIVSTLPHVIENKRLVGK